MLANYGSSEEGFVRKDYLEILEEMQSMAKEFYGEGVSLSDRSPLGMYLRAIAWQISLAWEGVENSHYNSFSLYANGVALDDAVSNFGRLRFDGTKSTSKVKIEGTQGVEVLEGFLVTTESNVIFKTLESVILSSEGALVEIESINIGAINNVPKGTITKIVNPIMGVDSVTNVEAAIGGSGIEEDESLRVRNLETLREPTTGDNESQYKVWSREVNGVGGVKVLSTTPRKGYVTIIIADTEGMPASSKLVGEVLSHINSLKPVNAGVYVEAASTNNIDVKLNIRLAEGYILSVVRDNLSSRIKGYFKGLSLSETYISHAQVGRLVLEVNGIIDYSELTLNQSFGNIELGNREVAILQGLYLELIE